MQMCHSPLPVFPIPGLFRYRQEMWGGLWVEVFRLLAANPPKETVPCGRSWTAAVTVQRF
jgi:hypothetical protein